LPAGKRQQVADERSAGISARRRGSDGAACIDPLTRPAGTHFFSLEYSVAADAHVILSLIAMASGVAVVYGLLSGKLFARLTAA
jgi:hypothetical protein